MVVMRWSAWAVMMKICACLLEAFRLRIADVGNEVNHADIRVLDRAMP